MNYFKKHWYWFVGGFILLYYFGFFSSFGLAPATAATTAGPVSLVTKKK